MQYLEVTLYLRGGGSMVFHATRISSVRDQGPDGGYSRLDWESMPDDHDGPKLLSVDPGQVAGITTRKVTP